MIYLSHHATAVVHNKNASTVLTSHVVVLKYGRFYTLKVIYSIQALYNYHFPDCVISWYDTSSRS